MKDISWEILEKYQVRKTRKQKTTFINFLREEIPELRVEESKLFKSRNLVVGDINKAKIVLGAHYDTCAKLPFPNFLTPKNLFIYLLYNLIVTAGLFFICSLVLFVTYFFTRNIDIAGWLYTATMWGVLFLMMFGPANKHNANDNTSGVITLLEIMDKIGNDRKDDVAFVFFDHEEVVLLGSAFFARKHKREMKNKTLINFDCVADGNDIMVIQNKQARCKHGDTMKGAFNFVTDKNIIFDKASRVIYPSDQANFSCSIAIAAFKKNKLLGLYINKIHTKKDTNFDKINIERISDGIINFLNVA